MKFSEFWTDCDLIVSGMHLRGKWTQKERNERNQSERIMITGRGPVRPTRSTILEDGLIS